MHFTFSSKTKRGMSYRYKQMLLLHNSVLFLPYCITLRNNVNLLCIMEKRDGTRRILEDPFSKLDRHARHHMSTC